MYGDQIVPITLSRRGWHSLTCLATNHTPYPQNEEESEERSLPFWGSSPRLSGAVGSSSCVLIGGSTCILMARASTLASQHCRRIFSPTQNLQTHSLPLDGIQLDWSRDEHRLLTVSPDFFAIIFLFPSFLYVSLEVDCRRFIFSAIFFLHFTFLQPPFTWLQIIHNAL